MSNGLAKAAQQHVAVLAFPFGNHASALMNLVRRVATAAPDVTFSFFCTAKSNASVSSSHNIKAYDVSDGVPEGYVFQGRPLEDINLFLAAAADSFKESVEAAEKDVGMEISCVMADAFLWFSGELAEEKGVPWIAVWTSSAVALSSHIHTDLIRQTIGLHGNVRERRDDLLTFVPGFSRVKVGDLPTGVVLGDLESPFAMMLHKVGQTIPRANVVVVNTFEDLEADIIKGLRAKLSNLLSVGGPFPKSSSFSDVYGCIPWLDQREKWSVAYIGFGTTTKLPPDELRALAEALEASKTPYLWSLKDDEKCNLPEGFPERTSHFGKIVPWAPQIQILSHSATGIFLSHCGWNSVLESIAAGVPMIGRPYIGDQQLDASMVENVWQVGVRIADDSFTKDKALQALDFVMSSEGGKKLKTQLEMFRELALKSVGPNGSSTQNLATLQNMIIGQKF